MRKSAIVLSAAVLALLTSWSANAATPPATPAPAASTAPAAPATPSAAAATGKKGKAGHHERIMGTVTAVDATTHAVTVTRKDTTSTFTLDPAVEVVTIATGTVANIKVDDRVRVTSASDIEEGASAVTATKIDILAPAKPKAKGKGNAKPDAKASTHVDGVVTTLSPLTIKTDADASVAVTTSVDTIVHYPTPGTVADIVVGARLVVEAKPEAAGPVAVRVEIAPAPDKGAKGVKGKKKK